MLHLELKQIVIQSRSGAHFCNFLLVINHQQRHRQQDSSEALNSFLKSTSRGQLVALLQPGDEVGEAQAHSGQSLLCPAVLKSKTLQYLHIYIFTFTKKGG